MGDDIREKNALGPAPALLYPLKSAFTHARAAGWLLRGAPSACGVRILFYHRVAAEPDELAVTPERFRGQMEALAAAGLRGVQIGEAAAAARAGETGVVGLSFDDGYLDVAEHGLPVLERLGFRATVFVATGVTDGRARFSWYARQPPLLSWAQIRELDAGGTLRFEAHTVTHPNLVTLAETDARREIEESKRELEQQLGRASDVFCYPAGLFGDRERRLVADAGFALAVSCEPGANTAATDPLALRRIQVDRRDRPAAFRAKALGGFDTPPPLRAHWRRLRYAMPSSRS